jgi:hypothetical protein
LNKKNESTSLKSDFFPSIPNNKKAPSCFTIRGLSIFGFKKILFHRLNTRPKSSPTRLYTHNIDVNKENIKELDKIPGKIYQYEMKSKGKISLIESLKKGCLAEETLRLKIGA